MNAAIHPSVTPEAVLTEQQLTHEHETSRLQRSLDWVKHAGHAAIAGTSNFAMGTHFTPEDVDGHLLHYSRVVRLTGHHTKNTVQDWHHNASGKDKLLRPFVGSMKWANLTLGEAAALAAQGTVQGAHPNSLVSFGAGVATALTVELVASAPAAYQNRNREEPVTSAEIARSMGVAFWLGGAWGVTEQKLGPKHMAYPIGSYLLFGAGVAALGEVNDVASHIIESPLFWPALITLGVTRTVNGIFEYEDGLDRLGNRTGNLVDRFMQRRAERKAAKQPKHKAAKSTRTSA